MHFALVENNRVEAQPDLHGLCPCCMKPVVAKCGTQRMWHWSHKSRRCDNWWEPETEWHRSWKNKYPTNWQEISFIDEKTGEKHIADICTANRFIVEFQHSYIKPEELKSREEFYKDMVWVVDGTRNKMDYPRFLKGIKNHFENQIFYTTDNPDIFKVDLIDWCFPKAWLKSSVPVIFDFWGDGSFDDSEGIRKPLYCLFPQIGVTARVAKISRKAFVHAITAGEWQMRVQNFMNEYRKQVHEELSQNRVISYSANKTIYMHRGVPLLGGRAEYLKRISSSHKISRRRRRF